MDIQDLKAAAIRVMEAEFSRVSHNIEQGQLTPELASLLFEHFCRAQESLVNEFGRTMECRYVSIPYFDYCNRLNPRHSETMAAYRSAEPASLKT